MTHVLFLKARKRELDTLIGDLFSPSTLAEQTVQVKPHVTKDGVFVSGHTAKRKKRLDEAPTPVKPTDNRLSALGEAKPQELGGKIAPKLGPDASLDYDPSATENTIGGVRFRLLRSVSSQGIKYWRVFNASRNEEIEKEGGVTIFPGETKAEKWDNVQRTLRTIGEDRFRKEFLGSGEPEPAKVAPDPKPGPAKPETQNDAKQAVVAHDEKSSADQGKPVAQGDADRQVEKPFTAQEKQLLDHAEHMAKPAVVKVASALANTHKYTSTLQAMVAMQAGRVPEAADLSTSERATAAWMAEALPMDMTAFRKENGSYFQTRVPVERPGQIDSAKAASVLLPMVGLDKNLRYRRDKGGFDDAGLEYGLLAFGGNDNPYFSLAGLAQGVRNAVLERPRLERAKRLLDSDPFKNPKTWGEKAAVMAEIVSLGLASKDDLKRALTRELGLVEPLKKEITAGAPSLDEITAGRASIDDLVVYRLAGSLNQAKVREYADAVGKARAAVAGLQEPGGRSITANTKAMDAYYDAAKKSMTDAGFVSVGNEQSPFSRSRVYGYRHTGGGIVELGGSARTSDQSVFSFPGEPSGLSGHHNLKDRLNAIHRFLLETGYMRAPTAEEIEQAKPKPKRPAPQRKVIVFAKPRETKETRKPAKAFYGAASRKEMDLPNKEITALMRADIKRGIAAGRIPKGTKVSVRTDHNSIDINVTGVPEGMQVWNPDWLVANANAGGGWVDTRDPEVRSMFPGLEETGRYSPVMKRVVDDLNAIHDKYNWDKSDIMSDYHNVNYYGSASVHWKLEGAKKTGVPDPNTAHKGDVITVGGNTYELRGEPPRWHRVGGEEAGAAKPTVSDEQRKAAAAKLRERADKAAEQAEEQIYADRQTNTRRRANMADGIVERNRTKAMHAKTLGNIADEMDSGTLQHLGKVRSIADIETLEGYLADARHDHLEANGERNYQRRQDRMSGPVDQDAFWHVKYPHILPEQEAWQQERVSEAQEKLRRLGIVDQEGLAEAIREYAQLRGEKAKEDPVKAAERALVGSKVGAEFFPTPKRVAERMVSLAGVKPGMRALEPSAGNGNLADAAKAAGAEVDAVEISDALRNILKLKGHEVVAHDFMDFSARDPYDAILMNPPFSKRQDAEHIMRAWSMLKPGGALVAIAGEGVFFGSDRKAQEFRDWLEENGAMVEKLPAGTFQDKDALASTGVNARLISVRAPVVQEPVFTEPELKRTGGMGLHVNRTPSGRFEYVGTVPSEIGYEDGATQEQIENGIRFGGRFGPKTRTFATEQEAIEFAAQHGWIAQPTVKSKTGNSPASLLQAAVNHLEEDAKQADLPPKEKAEDEALVARLKQGLAATQTGNAEDDARLERYREHKAKREARGLKGLGTAGSDRSLELLEQKAKADPTKWKPGDGVGWKVYGQTNRGFRVVSVDPDTKTAVIRQVADTGLTSTGGDDGLVGAQRVHIAYLVRDKKYNRPAAVVISKPNEEDFGSAQDYLDALQEWRAKTGNRNAYEDKQEDRASRMDERASKARRESSAAHKRADDISQRFYGGQPILVGHHSEKRARRDHERMDNAMRSAIDASDKAEYYAGKAAAARANTAVSSDDEDAIPKLRAKLEGLEAKQKLMKDANRIVKKKGLSDDERVAQLRELGLGEANARALLKPDFLDRLGFPGYELTNNNANIRRIKQRVESLERAQAAAESAPASQPFDGGTVDYDTDDNRLRIMFDRKPSAEIRSNLKANGFRWAPSVGAWQRQLNNSAKWAAERALGITLQKASRPAVLFLRASGGAR